MKPTLFDAVYSLVGGEMSCDEDVFESFDYKEGQTPPSKADAETKLAEMISDWEALEYARNRKDEYPDWGTQLNKIYDDGLTKWKSEMVDPIKAKWPKDNSGPV